MNNSQSNQPQRVRPLRETLHEPMPSPMLWATGKTAAILSAGELCILTGAGGVGKSLLAASVALAFATNDSGGRRPLPGGIFDGCGGGAVIAAYDDRASVLARRLAGLTEAWRADAQKAARMFPRSSDLDDTHLYAMRSYTPDEVALGFERLVVANMDGAPLYGPADGGSYNARPVRLRGWSPLFDSIREATDRLGDIGLIVIDPALGAYVGDANVATTVREFMGALRREAAEIGAGVVLVTHSAKSARKRADHYDPGIVAGSSAWVDGARGVMALMRSDNATMLVVNKSNLGAAPLHLPLTLVQAPTPAGFKAAEPWSGKGAVDDYSNIKV